MKLQLVVQTPGKSEGKAIPITLSQFLIGRDPQCHLRPASALISKRHCALLVREDRVFLRDFDSTNGTFLNDSQVKGEVELHSDDTLKVGPLLFKVRLEVGVPVTQPTPVPPTKAPDAPAKNVGTGSKTPLPPTKTPPPPAKPAAAAAEGAPAKAAAPAGEDDDAAAMLLALGDDGDGASGVPSLPDVPEGSTVMDLPSPFAAKSEEAAKKDDKDKKPKPPGNTSSAAKEILEKYMRRPRT
jgi:predicted component of type VI protein secretion system